MNGSGQRLALPGRAEWLDPLLARAADPARAARLTLAVLPAAAAAAADELDAVIRERPRNLAFVLAGLGGMAPFFVSRLTRHPRWLMRLAREDLRVPVSVAEYRKRLRVWIARGGGVASAQVLRCFKYYELARITVRDAWPELVPPERGREILQELSRLAEVLLEASLDLAWRQIESEYGPPRWHTAGGGEVALGFSVLGLGKLGAEELNYSSDVDLIYVFEGRRAADRLLDGPGDLGPSEYFVRLARKFGRVVGYASAEGFLYRVDLNLRPEGVAGELVVSSDSLVSYYDRTGQAWEKGAFMKARPVAGDRELGWRVIRAVHPTIYRSGMDLDGIAAMREMKERIEREKGRDTATFNVKLGRGGIRDVEFLAQGMQLMHGARMPQVRVRSTPETLAALEDVGVLSPEEAQPLLTAYRFLRRLENRLQMEAERQVHRLPEKHRRLRRLARAMGFIGGDEVAAFQAELARHRDAVREVFDSVFHQTRAGIVAELFWRNVSGWRSDPFVRGMVEDLAARLAREVNHSSDPERAMNNLDRFISGVGRRRFYYELLLDRPELVRRLVTLFAASEYLSGYLATHPRLIEPIFANPGVLLLSRAELEEAFRAVRASVLGAGSSDRTEIELELDALRVFHNRELVNVGLLDLADKVSPPDVERALSDLAEVCVEQALVLAHDEMRRRSCAVTGDFLIVAMGKFGSRELTYGSDLDVIFLYDEHGTAEDGASAQESFVRLAQKLIWALRTRTVEGMCYDIDARLRPSGEQGMLVTSLSGFDAYHARSARLWERQALLRARPVAGAGRLAKAFEAIRLRVLRMPLPGDAAREIARLRRRGESELAREGEGRYNFKEGRGGLNDIESIVQFLQLTHGREHEELLSPEPLAVQIDRLAKLGGLDAQDARKLRDGWNFLRRLASRLRIVANRSLSGLDSERGDLDGIARRLGYRSSQREGGARRGLIDDYIRKTSEIRRIYATVFEADARA